MFTAADLVDVAPVRPLIEAFGYVPITQTMLAQDVVRYCGEPLAVVVAGHRRGAEDAAERVEIDIDMTDPVTDLHAALAPAAPLVRDDAPGNLVVDTQIRDGSHRAGSAPHPAAPSARDARMRARSSRAPRMPRSTGPAAGSR